MNLPAALLAIRWLIWDTIRQSLATRIFWLMLFVSVLAMVFCAGVSTVDLPLKPIGDQPERLPASDPQAKDPKKAEKHGVDVIQGELTLLFGSVRIPTPTYREDAIRWLQLVLAGGVADTAGLLLALIWTAAFLPGFLEPSSISVLLAKPIPRWSLLAGKYLGVLVFVLLQASIFVVGTWLMLALRTQVWDPRYLVCVPLLVMHFAIFFSFSCLLAVWTRSTIVCVVGSLVFWALCWGMNYGRHVAVVAVSEYAGVATGASWALEAGYWVLPKPFDLGYLLSQALGASEYFPIASELQAVEKLHALSLEASVVSSLIFAVLMLALAGYELFQAEY